MSANQFPLFETLDLRNANETVLVANTPSYLLDRLRKDNAVAQIAQTLPTAAILATLRESSARDPERVQDVVQRYVYLVAASMKDPSEIWPELAEINLRKLEWGDQLRDLIRAENVATSRIIIGTTMQDISRNSPSVQATTTRTNETVQRDPEHNRVIIP
jgi:hypothetical protein